MAVILLKTAAVLFGLIVGMAVGGTVCEMIVSRSQKAWTARGYEKAVRDIMRYGYYYGADGEKHEVENILRWQD